MQPDGRRLALTREWLLKAFNDGVMAQRALQPPAIPEMAAFHSQQRAEKVLKGYLTWHSEEFDWTHNLGRLVRLCSKLDDSFAVFIRAAEQLTPYATASRNPEYGPPMEVAEAEQAIALAHEMYEFVLDRLPASVHP